MKTLKLMSRMWIWTLLLVLPGVASGLRLLNVSGPSVVVNGSTPLLVLDCEYELSERDKHGLVVKWYFNRNPFPSYQWMPNELPQALGILKGRVDPNYHVSDNPFMKYRALAIRNPTVELTGEYTCWISSFEKEAMARKNVIIYSPASELTLTWTKPTDMSVLVLCKASGVYPEPYMAIYRSDGTTHRNDIGADVQLSQDETGYSVSAQLELYDYELEKETIFECVLKIPGTEYQVHDKILYYPVPDYGYESDDELPHYLDEHQYIYDLQQSHQGGAPTTTTTTMLTTTTSTSTTAAFVPATDDNINVNDINEYPMANYLTEHTSNNNVNKENYINIDSASKAESVTAEDSPWLTESGTSNNNVNKENYINIDLASKAESVTAEESPWLAESGTSNNNVNKKNYINIDLASKAESVPAEESPWLAESGTSNNNVNKKNDINTDSVSKAESVTAEESPRVAESVSGGENNSWSHILICSIVLILNILQ